MDDETYEKADEIADTVLNYYTEGFNLFSSYERTMAYIESDNIEEAKKSISSIYNDLDNMDKYKVELKEELVELEKLL